MNNTVELQASDNVKNFGDFWTSLVIKVYNPSNGSSLTVYINNAATNYSTKKITLDKIGKNELTGYTTIQGVYIKTPVFGDSADYKKMYNNYRDWEIKPMTLGEKILEIMKDHTRSAEKALSDIRYIIESGNYKE